MKYNSTIKIVPGRLYSYKGSVVRAGRLCSNKYRHVKAHNQLHGFVPDNELELIPKSVVNQYLANA